MASIRFKFRASSVSGKQGTLFIQVIHRRVARQVSTQYKLYPGEWDPAGQSVTVPKDTLPYHSRYLHAVQEALQQDASRLQLIITHPGEDDTRQYQNKIHLINHYLKKLGEELGLSSKLTSYVARHSWASIAKSQDVPLADISEAMGHSTQRTTYIYLKSFENTPVDRANRKVLSVIA